MNTEDLAKERETFEAFFALIEARVRARCIELVLAGTDMPVQTRTLEILQRDRRRIAKLIAGEDPDLRRLVDSYTMASEENNV